MSKNYLGKVLALLLAVLMLSSLVACADANSGENAKDAVNEALEDAQDALEDAEDELADAADELKDEVEDAVEDAKDAVEDAADKIADEKQDENQREAVKEADEKALKILSKVRSSKFPLTVEDSADRKVVFEHKVEKIVSLGPNMTETVFALGAGDRLVGRTDYCDFPAEVSEIESVGTLMEPNIEKIIELKPDVVLASTHVSEEFIQKLEEVNIPALVLYDEEELDGLEEIFAIIGQILDLNQEAAELSADVFSRIEYIDELLDDLEKPTVYYVVGFGEHGDFTATGETFLNDLLEQAQVKNIAEDAKGWTFSVEALLEADPDYILLPAWADGIFQETEPYKELTAVKEGRVILVDDNIFSRQGPRVADAVELLAEEIHPEVFVEYKKVA
ncbi:MAG: helical backbone metal receptor [Eubacteriales bacterium]|nr:helical backbone metal receptor [Eubacteriales bacterium]